MADYHRLLRICFLEHRRHGEIFAGNESNSEYRRSASRGTSVGFVLGIAGGVGVNYYIKSGPLYKNPLTRWATVIGGGLGVFVLVSIIHYKSNVSSKLAALTLQEEEKLRILCPNLSAFPALKGAEAK